MVVVIVRAAESENPDAAGGAPPNVGVRFHDSFRKEDCVQTSPSPIPHRSTAPQDANCRLQVHGTAILDTLLSELSELLQSETGDRAEVRGSDFGREGWTLNTRFASPHNLNELLSSIERTIRQHDIPAEEITVSIEDEDFPLVELI